MSEFSRNETALDVIHGEADSGRVEIPKAAQVVATRIRRKIIDGELKRGERLSPEAELATSFAVSRPIVREALRILESENFIKLGRGTRKGATICQPTTGIVARATGIALRMKGTTLGDICEARALVEPSAARFAALRRPKEASAALCRHISYQHKVVDDLPKFLRSIGQFHRILLEECGNMSLSVIGQALQSVVEAHLEAVRVHDPDLAETARAQRHGLRSYERLADLIAAHDGPGAEAHWLVHINVDNKYWLGGACRQSVIEILH